MVIMVIVVNFDVGKKAALDGTMKSADRTIGFLV